MNEQLVLGLSLKEALEKEDFFILEEESVEENKED